MNTAARRRAALTASVLLAAAGLASAQPSAAPAKPVNAAAAAAPERPTIAQFMKIRAPGSATLAPDGTLYVRDWPKGIWQLYKRPAGAAKDAPMVQMTEFPDGLASYALSPDGKSIVLSAAQGGNEQTQLYLLDPAADGGKGKITGLLENPKVVYRFSGWERDSSGFYYTANDTSPSDFHVYRFDLKSKTSEKLLDRPGDWSVADSTQDGSRILLNHYLSASQAEVFELDTKTKAATDISIKTPQGELAASGAAGYLPGEASVLVQSDVEEGVARLFVRDLASGKLGKPLAGLDRYEIDAAVIGDTREVVVVDVNEDGFGQLHAYELPAFKEIKLPEIPKGVVGVNDLRGRTVVYSLSNANTPGLAFAATLKGAAADTVTPLTTADTQGIDLSKFPLPQLIKYTSFDGLEIPAFLYTPPGHKAGTPVPFVVNYHGGPEGQSRPVFDRTIQFLLSRGFGVMLPNVRGSTGYGRAFQMKDNYKSRWESVRDGVEAARWLVKNGHARAGKVAAYGGSYGGFMSVATIVEDGASPSPVFGASVDVVGIVNFKTFLEQTKDYRRKLREVEYGPLSDPEFLASVSPLNRIDKIKVPMLIAHGLNDPRVPVGEALQLHLGLLRRGMEPELLVFPDEGHGFQKLDNRLLFAERMAAFLDRTIGK
jgi:dipeptidyl aminopeptidase/acylaminoacyl peptidase